VYIYIYIYIYIYSQLAYRMHFFIYKICRIDTVSYPNYDIRAVARDFNLSRCAFLFINISLITQSILQPNSTIFAKIRRDNSEALTI
jgi:hypothetical protein